MPSPFKVLGNAVFALVESAVPAVSRNFRIAIYSNQMNSQGGTAGASWSAKGKSSERTELAEADSNHRGHSGHRLLPHSAGQSYAALSSISPLAAERIFARGPPDDPTAALVALPLSRST